jgi:hypothetical protein
MQYPSSQHPLHPKMTLQQNWNAASGRYYNPIGSDQDGIIQLTLLNVYQLNLNAGQYPTRRADESGIQPASHRVTIDDP